MVVSLHELAKYLYERETITGEEFMTILNRREMIEEKSSDQEGNV